MTTAVDSNILIDILSRDPSRYQNSRKKLREAVIDGALIISEPAFAEISPGLATHERTANFLASLNVALERSKPEALHLSGVVFQRYLDRRRGFHCATCGAAVNVFCSRCSSLVTRRQHVLADFMIGAHALVHAGRLLTRDRGYYGTYFPDLTLV